MHLLTILAFAAVYWQAEDGVRLLMVRADDVWISLIAAVSLPFAAGAAGVLIARRGMTMASREGSDLDAVHEFQHRAAFVMRCAVLGWFAALVLLTRWPALCSMNHISPFLQIVGDWVVLSPFMLAMVMMWLSLFPLERRLRGPTEDDAAPLRFKPYLDFHVRHYLLVVAVPMSIILFGANVIRAYEEPITRLFRSVWAPDVLLTVVAGIVFIVAPLLLRRVWRTHSIEPGPARMRLEEMCRRIGLRCRDLLVWNSDGMMINAAVMGVVPRFRYVMLSDALLSHMSARQVEAVFGHEAGHICKRHIQQFLTFALVGWLLVVGLMELFAAAAIDWQMPRDWASLGVKSVGVGVTVVFWAVGFGMLSRRFERQADLFGARCVTPEPSECRQPCSVHLGPDAQRAGPDRVCASAARLFASALDRVAILNGIPHDEYSWRHSSIANRMQFLARAAGDPYVAEAFERKLRLVRRVLAVTATLGGIAFLIYWLFVPQPAVLQLLDASANR